MRQATVARSFSSLGRNRALRGFSLLEIIFVLSITAIVIGSAAYVITSPKLEKEIRDVHNAIEDLGLQARAMAYSYQQPFVVEFREGKALMQPLARPDQQVSLDDDWDDQSTSLRPLDSMDWPRQVDIGEYQLSIRRWNNPSYKLVEDRVVERWVHQPNQACEPIGIQLETYDGSTLLSRDFHPLTARGVDDEMIIGNTK